MKNSNKTYVSPILRRVFSRSNLYLQTPHCGNDNSHANEDNDMVRSESRMSDTSSSGKNELSIDVSTEENVQFMDQPLRGKIDLSGLKAPVESVSISLRGVVKTCVAGNAAWASGFGGDSNVLARFTEKEILKQDFGLHPCTQPAQPLAVGTRHSLPFVFLFPGSANLPPSMTFPQGLGCVEYTLNVLLKGKKKFGSAKKWTSTLILKVEISRRAIGAKLEQMAIADSALGKTKHNIMLEYPRIILPGYMNHYFTLHFPQGLLQVHTFDATLVQKSFYKALGGNYRGASMVGLVCRVGQTESNVRESAMERVHVEIQEVGDEGLESSVEVDGIIERKHFLRVEVAVIVFKRGIEKVFYEVPVTVQCAAVPASHIDRRGTMSSMTSASSVNLRYLNDPTIQSNANLRSSRSLGNFPSPPTRPPATSAIFDASPPQTPCETSVPPSLGKVTRMNSKTWRDDELPGLPVIITPPQPQLGSPARLEPKRKRNWTLVKPGIATLDSLQGLNAAALNAALNAPTPPPTCPIPEVPSLHMGGVAPLIPPRSSSRLATARQALPSVMTRTESESSDVGRRGSQDTMTTSSVTSSPSDYSRNSTASTAATSVASSPGESTLPLKNAMRGGSLRKVDEKGNEGFDFEIYRKGEIDQRREFQRRIDLALSEVEKLASEESEGEGSDGENEILAPRPIRAM